MKILLVLLSFFLVYSAVSAQTFSTGASTNTVPGDLAVTGSITVTNTSTTVVPLSINIPSGQATNLVDVKLNGASKFKMRNDGKTTFTVPNISSAFEVLGGQVSLASGSVTIADDSATGLQLYQDYPLKFGSDTYLRRDSGNTVAQRNGAASQEFRIYNTYTDAGNYERAYGRWSGNVYTIGTEALGTGTQRPLQIMFGTNVLGYSGTNLTWNGVAIIVP